MKRNKTLSISGILILLLTMVLFSILTEVRTEITWLSFGFIIFAELLLFGGLIAIEVFAKNSSQIIYRAGGGVALTVYSLISIGISLIHLIAKTEKTKSFWVIQSLLFVAVVIILLVFITIAKSVKEHDTKVLYAVNRVGEMVNRLTILEKDNSNSNYSKLLNKVLEDLKYSDTSTCVECDDAIESKITKLEMAFAKEDDDKMVAVDQLIEDIINLINQRKINVKHAKSGGL